MQIILPYSIDQTLLHWMQSSTTTLVFEPSLDWNARHSFHEYWKPGKNIPRSTILGTSLSTLIYILSTSSCREFSHLKRLFGRRPPLADTAADHIWGSWARYLIGAGPWSLHFGALNGWILMQGQVPAAAAMDGLPKIFAKKINTRLPIWASYCPVY